MLHSVATLLPALSTPLREARWAARSAVRAGPPPSEFPAPPRVPKRAAPAAVSEMEQARSIEATLNQATISSSTVISHGAAPTGMAQRNALVGELDPLEL